MYNNLMVVFLYVVSVSFIPISIDTGLHRSTHGLVCVCVLRIHVQCLVKKIWQGNLPTVWAGASSLVRI